MLKRLPIGLIAKSRIATTDVAFTDRLSILSDLSFVDFDSKPHVTRIQNLHTNKNFITIQHFQLLYTALRLNHLVYHAYGKDILSQ